MTPENPSACHIQLERYLDLYRHIQTADFDLADILVSPDFHFTDPFNDFRGADQLKRLLAETRRDVKQASFEITHIWQQAEGEAVIVKWVFRGKARLVGTMDVTGLSEIRFDDKGRIAAHHDYWDAAAGLYGQIPVLGRVLDWIKKRLAVS